jgi:hypothetical protein
MQKKILLFISLSVMNLLLSTIRLITNNYTISSDIIFNISFLAYIASVFPIEKQLTKFSILIFAIGCIFFVISIILFIL